MSCWLWAGLLVSAIGCQTASATSAPELRRVVVLGDSLAAGHGLEASEAFPVLLQAKIDAAGWRFQVVNASVSGDTTADGLRRIGWLLKQRVDVLVLELGGNDGLRGFPPETTERNLQSIMDKARAAYPGIRIVIAGMQMPPNYGSDYTDRFKVLFPELARKNHATLVPFLLEGVGGRSDLNQADQIHPTAEGQKIVAENVWQVLKPVLEKLVHATGSDPAGR